MEKKMTHVVLGVDTGSPKRDKSLFFVGTQDPGDLNEMLHEDCMNNMQTGKTPRERVDEFMPEEYK